MNEIHNDGGRYYKDKSREVDVVIGGDFLYRMGSKTSLIE